MPFALVSFIRVLSTRGVVINLARICTPLIHIIIIKGFCATSACSNTSCRYLLGCPLVFCHLHDANVL